MQSLLNGDWLTLDLENQGLQTAAGPLDDGNVTRTAAATPGAPPGAAWGFLASWKEKCLRESSLSAHLHFFMNQKACSHDLKFYTSRFGESSFKCLLQEEHGRFSGQPDSHKRLALLPVCSQYITLKIILKIIEHFPKVTFLWKQLM